MNINGLLPSFRVLSFLFPSPLFWSSSIFCFLPATWSASGTSHPQGAAREGKRDRVGGGSVGVRAPSRGNIWWLSGGRDAGWRASLLSCTTGSP